MRRHAAVVIAVAGVVLLIASASPATARTRFGAVDAAMRTRVHDDALNGGVLLAVRGTTVLHERSFRKMTPRTVFPIASASKWLTSATLMTFVDEGRLHLDDPVARYLSDFRGAKRAVTVRELLSHTTGLPSAACEGDPSTTLARCARAIARGPDPVSPPGS